MKLDPTPREIQDYADLKQDDYGVVTYSKSKGGDYYFLRLHDTWKQKVGRRVYIDIGYVERARSRLRQLCKEKTRIRIARDDFAFF